MPLNVKEFQDYAGFVKRMENTRILWTLSEFIAAAMISRCNKAKLKKQKLCKKNGFSYKDYDSEFRLREIYGGLK